MQDRNTGMMVNQTRRQSAHIYIHRGQDVGQSVSPDRQSVGPDR